METKTKIFEVKEFGDNGSIAGYFSTYDRIPDSYGDVVAPGAFTETIKARKESGHPFPLCWNHDLDQIIGAVDPDDIIDTEKGPYMQNATFFDTPLAQEKRDLVKSGVVFQFSFAYSVLEEAPVDIDGVKANELQKIDLFEISIVPIPANPRAEVTEIKSGRRTSAKDGDSIKGVIGKLNESISALEALLDDKAEVPEEGEDRPEANAAAEEPRESNPEKDNLLTYIKALEEDNYES